MTERKLKDVSQRNPAAPEHSADVFDRMFTRGPDVAADGGERGAASPASEGADDESTPVGDQTMKDVDQTPPDEDAGANSVWERGGEPAVEDVDGDVGDE
ncbi:MAG: hypothetical protein ABEH83_08285 [Halobacterium sp.]